MLHMTTWILITILIFDSKYITKYIKQSPHCLLKLLINYVQRSVPYSVINIKSGLNISIVGSWKSFSDNVNG
jgi:hypothetical protein